MTDTATVMQERRARRAMIFGRWLDELPLPEGYDRDMLYLSAIQNTVDVPVNQIIDCAKATVREYLDEPARAREAGIVE